MRHQHLKIYLFFVPILLFLNFKTFGQTKIYLITTKPWGDYEYLNKSDTSFIYTSYSEDMGVHYSAYYNFNDEHMLIINDGEYEVYINGKLDLIAFFKNNLRDSIWTEYSIIEDTSRFIRTTQYKNGKKEGDCKLIYTNGKYSGEYSICHYKNDLMVGQFIEYYANGNLKTIGTFYGEIIPIRTYFYETGQIAMREYFTNDGSRFRVELYDRDGYLKQISTIEPREFAKEESFKKVKLNGKQIISFNTGKYEIIFESNKIKKWIMFDINNNVLFEE